MIDRDEMIRLVRKHGSIIKAAKMTGTPVSTFKRWWKLEVDQPVDCIFCEKNNVHRRIMIVSDTHLGSKWEALSELKQAYKFADKMGIKNILHAGDLTDGWGMRQGHIRDIKVDSIKELIAYTRKKYPRIDGITTHIVSGNHDDSTHNARNKFGIDMLEIISDYRDDIIYHELGNEYMEIEGITFFMKHGNGGATKTKSLNVQNVADNAVTYCEYYGYEKPQFVIAGHIHIPLTISNYRNMYLIQAPSFQHLSKFFLQKGWMTSRVGFMVLEIPRRTGGIEEEPTVRGFNF